MRKILLSVPLLVAAASPGLATPYQVDPVHSGVSFRVTHMVITKVTGRFERFEGTFEYEPGRPQAWKAQGSVEAKSINTNVEKRDTHLRSSDFLDADRCPKLEFASKKVTNVRKGRAKLLADLTIRCVTKPIQFDLEIGGAVKDPWGNERAGFIAKAKINRKDFGVAWHQVLETGGLVVGDEVEITLEVEGIAQKKEEEKTAP